MSILSLAVPVQFAMPVIRSAGSSFFAVTRSVVGVGMFVGALTLFKPLVVGLARAALLLVSPRQTLKERIAKRRLRGIVTLNRMASELDQLQPNLAAELRYVASRD
jgi:hypothetical protein